MAEAGGRRAGAVVTLGTGLGLAALALSLSPAEPALPPPRAEAADLAARRAETGFDGAEAVFAARFARDLGRRYDPLRLRTFVRATVTPCAGIEAASGPFFCPETRDAAMDLAVIAALEPWLGRDAGAGAALLSARLAAAHAAAALGPGADADCLAGVFARDAAERLGPVSPALYGRILAAAGRALKATSPQVEWRDPGFFGGRASARAAAFERGASSTGRISGCA